MIAADSNLILAPSGRPAFLEAIENNWYEASRWSPNRSWVWYPLQDAKQDLDRFTRYELNKHARYLYKNSPLIRGIIERVVTLTVGDGFYPVFKSSKSPDWAKMANSWWVVRARNISLGPRCSFSQYQRAVGRARFVDGECFSIKTFNETTYQDCIQGIEADRVTGGSGDSLSEKRGSSVDGVNLNSQGVVVSYKLRNADEPYAAADIIHHMSPIRLGQYRGETLLASAINTARDVDDILSLEKQCVKDASSHMDIIKTTTGEINPEQMRTLRYQQQYPTTFNLPADNRTKDDYYRVAFGAQPIVLRKGDEYTPYSSGRPGAAWQGFMDFLANTICLSSCLPPSVILPINVGGTDIRRDLDIAQRVVSPWQLDIVSEVDEIVRYLTDGEIADGVLRGAPDDWTLSWHFPPKVNVDRQTAQQDRSDYQAGLMSAEEYHGRYGEDGDTYEQTVIDEVKRRKDRIARAGFKDVQEFVQVLSMNPQLFQKQQPNEPQVKE